VITYRSILISIISIPVNLNLKSCPSATLLGFISLFIQLLFLCTAAVLCSVSICFFVFEELPSLVHLIFFSVFFPCPHLVVIHWLAHLLVFDILCICTPHFPLFLVVVSPHQSQTQLSFTPVVELYLYYFLTTSAALYVCFLHLGLHSV